MVDQTQLKLMLLWIVVKRLKLTYEPSKYYMVCSTYFSTDSLQFHPGKILQHFHPVLQEELDMTVYANHFLLKEQGIFDDIT